MRECKLLVMIANRLYSDHRRRNISVSISIALSTALVLLMLSTMGTLHESVQERERMMFGTKAEAYCPYASGEQLGKLTASGVFDEVGSLAILGRFEWNGVSSDSHYIFYATEESADMVFNPLTCGEWPAETDEVVVDESVARGATGSIEVGDKVPVRFFLQGREIEFEATVTGICRGNGFWEEKRLYVSEAFYRRSECDAYRFYGSFDESAEDAAGVKAACQALLGEDRVVFAYETLETGENDAVAKWASVIAFLFTFVCSSLIVYSIYYISIVNNVKQYGQWKLIGMRDGQLRFVMVWQMLRQYLPGYAAGCVLGYASGYLLVPLIERLAGLGDLRSLQIRVSYLVIAFAASFLALVFGAVKPFCILKRIEPIQTVGFYHGANRRPMKERRFTVGVFARRNLKIQKKKAFLLVLSIAMSVALFVLTANAANSLSVDKLLQRINLPADIVIAPTKIVESIESGYLSNSESMPEKIGEDVGVLCAGADIFEYYTLRTPFYLSRSEAEAYSGIVRQFGEKTAPENIVSRIEEYRLDGKDILCEQKIVFYSYEELQACTVFEGEIDKSKFESGEYCLAVAMGEEGIAMYRAGDTVVLCNQDIDWQKVSSESRDMLYRDHMETRNYQVLAVTDDYYGERLSKEPDGAVTYILPRKCMGEMSARPSLQAILVNAGEAEWLEEADAYVERYVEATDGLLSYRSKKTYLRELRKLQAFIRLIGNSVALLVGVMAVVSFLNGCASGIAERREEFRTLRAIGMTGKQLLGVLKMENLYCVLAGSVLGLLLGNLLSVVGISMLEGSIFYLKLRLNILPGIFLAAILTLMSVFYPNKRTKIAE